MTMNTELKLKKNSKGEIEKAFLTGCRAFYTKVQKAAPVYEQRDMGDRATKTEYTVDLVVSEEVADSFDEIFTKQTSTKLTKEKFKQKYKIEDDAELPDPKAKKFFVVKCKQKAQKADGQAISPKIRPRVVQVVDGKPVDITFDKLVGNNSGVDVMLGVSSNSYGTFSYLRVIKVTDLVEYASGGGSDEDTQEFLGGDLELAEEPEDNGVDTSQGSEEDAGEEPPFEMSDEDDDEY